MAYVKKSRLTEVSDFADVTPVEAEPLPIRRFTVDMVDEWLLGRLNAVWPHLGSEQWWKDKLADFSRSNSHMFITNGEAVLCAYWLPHPVTMAPEPIELFAFTRSARLSYDNSGNYTIPGGDDRALCELYKHAREWKRSLNAFRMIGGKCSDFPYSMLNRMLKAQPLADIR